MTGEPTPKAAGQAESFTVTGLSANTTYYFALKVADEVPNWSEVCSPTMLLNVSVEPAPPAMFIWLKV